MEWVKAATSGTGNCVEIRRVLDRVQIRDSKDPTWVVEMSEAAWAVVLDAARSGALDHLG